MRNGMWGIWRIRARRNADPSSASEAFGPLLQPTVARQLDPRGNFRAKTRKDYKTSLLNMVANAGVEIGR